MQRLAQASQPKTFSPLRIPGMPAILSRRTLSNSMLKLPSLKPPGKPKPLNLKTPSLTTAQPATAQSETDQPAADVPDDQQRTAAEAYQEATAAGVADQQPAAETAQQSVSEAYDIDSTGVHTPVFEPGSVFERVAKGELKAQEPAVEVDGLTSDEAKTTQDFNVQFEVARHPDCWRSSP